MHLRPKGNNLPHPLMRPAETALAVVILLLTSLPGAPVLLPQDRVVKPFHQCFIPAGHSLLLHSIRDYDPVLSLLYASSFSLPVRRIKML